LLNVVSITFAGVELVSLMTSCVVHRNIAFVFVFLSMC